MQIKQRVHLPMKLCDQEGIWKTQLYTDSLSPNIKPPYNKLQNITSIICCTCTFSRDVFPLISLHELTPITDAHQWNTHDKLEQTIQ